MINIISLVKLFYAELRFNKKEFEFKLESLNVYEKKLTYDFYVFFFSIISKVRIWIRFTSKPSGLSNQELKISSDENDLKEKKIKRIN